MLNIHLYKSAGQSLVENPIWKAAFAALISLFHVPIEFVVGLPIFWLLDFWAGMVYSRKQAIAAGKEKWFEPDRVQKQFGKITLQCGALIGIVVLSNLFNVPILITIGFAYIIGHEFLFSSLPKFLGEEKASMLAKHVKDALLSHYGLDSIFKNKGKKNQ